MVTGKYFQLGGIPRLQGCTVFLSSRPTFPVHLVYCVNVGKKGEKALDKILAGTKTMVVRGAAGRKITHSRVFEGERIYFMEKRKCGDSIIKGKNQYLTD